MPSSNLIVLIGRIIGSHEMNDMNSNEANLLDPNGISRIAHEVINAACAADVGRPSSKAILAFAVRLAGSWRSIVTLVKHHPEQDDLRSLSNDCAVILRCMYDAYLQMRWIAVGPNDPDEMGKLYLGFKVVERYKLVEIVVDEEDDMSEFVASSRLLTQHRAKLGEDYESAKSNYPKSSGKGVRNHWYPGSLGDLARDLHAAEEYTWFVRMQNSGVHTGPRAMFCSSDPNARQLGLFSESILIMGLSVLATHDNLALSDFATKVMDAYSASPFSVSFRS